MDDEHIVALYWSRSETALKETETKYGSYLTAIAHNILLDREDAQECGNNASISGYDAIEIVSQNFGFDLQNRITEVTLDLSEPHYWLEVRKTALD